MRVGKVNVHVPDCDIYFETVMHYLKSCKAFEIEIPAKYRESEGQLRLSGNSEEEAEKKLRDYIRENNSLEDRLEKVIQYSFTGVMNPPNGEIGSADWDDVWGDLSPAVESGMRLGHHLGGVCINRSNGDHKIEICFKVIWVDKTRTQKKYYKWSEHYGKFKATYDGISGEEVPYTEELFAFLTELTAALDKMAAEAARWLMQDNALELMQSGIKLLTLGETK